MPAPKHAIAFHKEGGISVVRSADNLCGEFGDRAKEFVLFASDGRPLTLAYQRAADGVTKTPFFSRQVISPRVSTLEADDLEGIVKAIDDGKRILFSPIEEKLLPQGKDLHYSVANDGKRKPLRVWLPKHFPDFVRVPIKSIHEIMGIIEAIRKDHPPSALKKLAMVFRGSVSTYRTFEVGKKRKKISFITDELVREGKGVAVTDNATFGRPAMFRFVPTKATLNQKGNKQQIRGNHFAMYKGGILNIYNTRLRITNSEQNREDYPKLLEMLQEHQQRGLSIWAVPFLDKEIKDETDETTSEDKHSLEGSTPLVITNLMLTIYSIRDQIRPAPEKGVFKSKAKKHKMLPGPNLFPDPTVV